LRVGALVEGDRRTAAAEHDVVPAVGRQRLRHVGGGVRVEVVDEKVDAGRVAGTGDVGDHGAVVVGGRVEVGAGVEPFCGPHRRTRRSHPVDGVGSQRYLTGEPVLAQQVLVAAGRVVDLGRGKVAGGDRGEEHVPAVAGDEGGAVPPGHA